MHDSWHLQVPTLDVILWSPGSCRAASRKIAAACWYFKLPGNSTSLLSPCAGMCGYQDLAQRTSLRRSVLQRQSSTKQEQGLYGEQLHSHPQRSQLLLRLLCPSQRPLDAELSTCGVIVRY